MLPRGNRLARSRDIQRVLRTGQLLRGGPFLALKYVPQSAAGKRFAFIVSTKVAKRATVRNRIKRQLRAGVARHLPLFPDADYVVLTRPGQPLPSPTALRHELEALLRTFFIRHHVP